VSIVCIAISVIALITVMSVMNGFDYQMRDRILGAVSHATISGIGESVQDWPRALQTPRPTRMCLAQRRTSKPRRT
jgi:lipoprotein-releasing system permease protein